MLGVNTSDQYSHIVKSIIHVDINYFIFIGKCFIYRFISSNDHFVIALLDVHFTLADKLFLAPLL